MLDTNSRAVGLGRPPKQEKDTPNGQYSVTVKKKGINPMANPLHLFGGPNGIRTRVTDVRGQCPRPLDDGTSEAERTLFNLKLTKKQIPNQALNIERLLHRPAPSALLAKTTG